MKKLVPALFFAALMTVAIARASAPVAPAAEPPDDDARCCSECGEPMDPDLNPCWRTCWFSC
jgi:hypothetical protein